MTLSKTQMAMYAATAGFPYPTLMAEVGNAESGGDPNVVNSIGAVGVLQILQPVHVKDHPSWTVSYLKNPLNNFLAAKTLWDGDIKAGGTGLGPWADSKDKGNGGGWGKTQAYKDFAGKKGIVTQAGISDIPGELTSPFLFGLESAPGGDAVAGTVNGLGDIASAIGKTASWVGNPHNWLRILYVLAGGVVVSVTIVMAASNSKITQQAMGISKKVATKL